MKNYYIIILMALFFSCSGDLEDMNVDIKNATEDWFGGIREGLGWNKSMRSY